MICTREDYRWAYLSTSFCGVIFLNQLFIISLLEVVFTKDALPDVELMRGILSYSWR